MNAQRYTVIGLGGSGLSAVNFLVAQGHQVAVTDQNPAPALADKLPAGVMCAFGAIDGQMLLDSDCIIISPGVDPRIKAVVDAKQAGVRVISDVQLFIETLKEIDQKQAKHTPIIAITGSNAKSTVTTLVGQMAVNAGVVVGVGGNIGTPALELLTIAGLQMVVLELSSFQLEHIYDLSADVATVLNISADHLDRHDGMADYLAQKLKIFEGAKAAVICQDDAVLAKECQQSLTKVAKIITTASQSDQPADFSLAQMAGELVLCHGQEVLLNANRLKIKGKHNLLNALSALALGQAVGLPMTAMLDALVNFKGLPHRCEYVDEVAGKAYFNDSKGTNIGSTLAAIDGLGVVYGEQSLALILGGQGKGQDFGQLADEVYRWANGVYLIGADAALIEQDLLGKYPNLADRLHQVAVLDKAVVLASQSDAKAVLLSPACASLDQFKNYGERGDRFVELVKSL